MTDDSLDFSFPRRGEIWLVETPNLPDDPHQPRPALVVSENVRNRLRDHVIVVPIFSAGRLGPTRVAVWTVQGGIDHDSVLFCEEISTLHHAFIVDGPLGQPVPPSLLGRVNRATRRSLGETVPEPS